MQLVDAMALAAAERVGRVAGAKAGLVAYRTLAANVRAMEPRARALLGALRCAVRSSDLGAVSALARSWEFVYEGSFIDEVIALAAALESGGHAPLAAELAAAEVARFRTARALYLRARCLESASDASAPAAFAEAAERADNEGAKALAASARARRIRWLARSSDLFATGLDEAVRADLRDASPADTLSVCRVRLHSPSRFVRAGALASLEELAKGLDLRLADAAMRVGANHADTYGDELTPLEVDRVASLLRHWRSAPERDAALARLAAVAKLGASPESEDALLGAAQLGDPPRLASLGLDTLLALEREWAAPFGTPADVSPASALLVELASLVQDAPSIPATVWRSAELGLASSSSVVRDDAARLSAALLSEQRKGPRGGFIPLARALEETDRTDLALRTLRAAHAAREPGARETLMKSLVARGWQLANRGEKQEAIRALREAKELAGG